MTHSNYDMTSIRGTALTALAYVASMLDIEVWTKIGLMGIGIISGVTTIVYNIQKIKKLKDTEKRSHYNFWFIGCHWWIFCKCWYW